ncbi:MAG TPA: Hpt domain-containing protein [Gammaproteobacteria bacterium]|nr:Hpt domain-containing protein [Gammaproteobacteria bacterium]
MDELASQSLELVNRELSQTLETARGEIEDFVDGQSDSESLVRAASMLHLAAGALKIVEIHGAALLAEEMEQVCRAIHDGRVKAAPGAAEALTRAMVQLPAYLDRLMSGGSDVALVLLPLLNDLRTARNLPMLSEGTLLLLNTGPFERLRTKRPAQPAQAFGTALPALGQKLRPKFQAALLGWIRGDPGAAHLGSLIEVCDALEARAESEPVRQLWAVTAGVLTALKHGDFEPSVSIKRLLGQADRQLKRLIDSGEQAFVTAPPVDLMNSLLYYVARATSDDDRLRDLRRTFGVDTIIPGADDIEQAREELAGPSGKLMRTVAEAIKEDLGQVKDVLDIFVRTGMDSMTELKPQLHRLKKIGDTLGVLGLETARSRIQAEAEQLAAIVAADKIEKPETLEGIAASLLDVEDMLDNELVSVGAPERERGESADGDGLESNQYKHVTTAVMRECIINLAKIKEVVVKVLDDPGSLKALDQVGPQMRGIVAGLLMLNKNRAVNIIERIGRTITTRLAPGSEALRPNLVERLADAIVSIEYYMETIALGRSDPFYMLDNANRCLDLLDRTAPEARPAPAGKPAPETSPAPEPPPAKPAAARAENLSVMAADEDHSEPELVEIFIEEAKEEIDRIREFLPRWMDQPEDSEALIAVRRSFHTLKGSGRVIGAELLGEFAWSVENLLNRIINQTLGVTPAMLELVHEAADTLPALVEQLEIGIVPPLDIGVMIARAEALTEGRTEPVPVERAPAAQAQAEDDAGMDPVLQQIFVKEVREHLQTVRAFVAEAANASPPVAITEALHRACHTLFGSARMAACAPAIDLAKPINTEIRHGFESEIGLTAGAVVTLGRFAGEIERLCAALEAGETFIADPNVVAATGALELAEPGTETDAKEATDAVAGETEAAPTEAKPAEAAAGAQADYDPEIAAIFCEEAAELLDHAETQLQALRKSARSDTALAEIKRILHTLKGGARLAGITAMGDLSHALETMAPKLAGAAPDGEGIRLAQQGLDQLHQMRDAVDAGQAAPPARKLIGRLERFGETAGPSDETRIEPAMTAEIPAVPPEQAAEAEPETDETGVQPPATFVMPKAPEPALVEAAELELPEVAELRLEETAELEVADEADLETPEAAEVETAEAAEAAHVPDTAAQPAAVPPAAARAERAEIARVDAGLLDELLNEAGEISIFQSRLNQQIHSIEFHLGELGQTVTRLREQLRSLEAETEAQILHRHQGEFGDDEQFDPLELDRYSTIQQLSRALAETSNDVASINELLNGLTSEADTLLTQQSRVTTELQDGLMQTRMVAFDRHGSRLARIVRQAADESGRKAELAIHGAKSQLDREILDAVLPALEHLLRNAVVHGIEPPASRTAAGKPESGTVSLNVRREGSEVLIEVADDGAGLDIPAIRRKAAEKGLVRDGESLADEDIVELILLPGFSTADELTQTAGRGVGMDVVDNEVKRLGGSLRIDTEAGKGTQFLIRLPYTLAITHALVVVVGDETFALPLPTIEGIARVRREELLDILTEDDPKLVHGDGSYRVQHLGSLVGSAPSSLPEDEGAVSLVLVRAGENSAALLTDSLEGSREIIVKTLGPHVASVDGVTGATILGDGRVVVILDTGTLLRAQPGEPKPAAAAAVEERVLTGLVVDDSITMRRVTQRLLERRGVRVHTARDGLDAIEVLREHEADFIVLDIEMPRMDGYQFATHVRNDPKLKELPIIMVTSRSGEKHRARAIEIGVNDYLSKPYQEAELVRAVEALVGRPL